MKRNRLIALIFILVLLALDPMPWARTLEKKDEADPVALLKNEQRDAREKELGEIAHIREQIGALEEQIRQLNQRLFEIKDSEYRTRVMLDELHDLVKKKEGLDKELKAGKKDLEEKEKDLAEEDARRREEVELLKADLKKDERKQRSAALKKDLRKYEKIISSPAIEDMNIKVSAWQALVVKYPEGAAGVAVGDTEELMFRVKYGGITNSIGMRFVLVQAGQFRMGSPVKEPYRNKNEARHRVMLKESFYLQTTEVTQGQWKEIMGENTSEFVRCGRDCPVENVSWDDCQVFISKLNQREKTHKYRLPTEAEWEYACRSGRSSAFANGAIAEEGCGLDPNLDQMGWYCANAWRKTHPVAEKKMNNWGFYDMHGNVWEWCQDWYGMYPEGAVVDPTGSRFGPKRVIRGGSFRNYAENCRTAYRFAYEPDLRMNNVGLRLARTR